MNRARIVMAVLSAIAFVTVAVPLADAGGGMGFGSGVIACRIIMNGTNPVQVVSVDVQSLSAAQVVNTGPASLVCESAAVDPISGPGIQAIQGTPEQLVCYPIQGANKPKETATITDPFTQSDPETPGNPSHTMTVGSLNLLCLPGTMTIP